LAANPTLIGNGSRNTPLPTHKIAVKQFAAMLRVLTLCTGVLFSTFSARAAFWVTGYYPGWEQADMPASTIDFTTLTHIIHFSILPNADGTLDANANNITTVNSADIVANAHAAGRQVLICVGGGGSESLFQGATSAANLSSFINNLTNFVAARGYDGVDIDWEPLPSTDAQQFTNLVIGLRTALNGFSQHKLLTVAAGAYPPYGDSATADYQMFAMLQNQFDQINIMTYDLSGPYEGWVTWFNSPIYDGGYHFPSSGGLVPSIDGAVNNFIANGVSPGKLGIGLAFYGYVWSGGSGTSTGGVTQPRQSWVNTPTTTAYGYNTIMSGYFQTNLYHWDDLAQAAYLSITNVNPADDMFVSYDDERSCQAKVSYARNHGLGGIMIWELAQDHEAGQTDPLLQSVKQALTAPGRIAIQFVRQQDIKLSFTCLPLGSYRVEWTSNLTENIWHTLVVTNITGPGGTLQIDDSSLSNQPRRFYRVQTPP
jgi:chitinase